ncbi:MAG TPA: hypothetical protein VFB58_06750 [Chloroflexota bacterium]|nr:hypothetical protein [Chloroflexota bacterium]
MVLLRAMVLGLLVLVSQAVPAGAAGSTVKVTVKITTTGGTVWGKVRLSYTAHGMKAAKTCGKAKCSFSVPRGVQLKLKETPTNTQTWPFKGWVIKSGMGTKHVQAASVSWHATAAAVIQAVYTLPSSNTSGSGTGSGWNP